MFCWAKLKVGKLENVVNFTVADHQITLTGCVGTVYCDLFDEFPEIKMIQNMMAIMRHNSHFVLRSFLERLLIEKRYTFYQYLRRIKIFLTWRNAPPSVIYHILLGKSCEMNWSNLLPSTGVTSDDFEGFCLIFSQPLI